ncbi:flavodoxin [Lactiplantibacillus paraplantarum]|uniref:flavodoxin n=1 Tax=Lactiplantibacillus paraplantarum TaxID=60520 RepID=UPI0021A8799D|nr:flavodoxin [Lactiplantibacillus paraplantarum]MCT4456207.1 flavodoxin [Lactiplantibacillus paraplantarum]
MRKISVVFWSVLVIAAVAIVGLISYQMLGTTRVKKATTTNGTSVQETSKAVKRQSPQTKKRTLIVYFSRAGQNYPDVNLKVGYTAQIANIIAKRTGADKYEIVPANAYPKNYHATVERATREQNENARPKIKKALPNMKKYDTIFLGYPIWDAQMPMIMHTFMEAENMNGKTIIPFSTNSGSAWANSLTTIRKQYPKATLRKGFEVPGAEVKDSHAQINSWLKKLRY